jgi:hypothetical protein
MGYLTESHGPHGDLRGERISPPEYRAAVALNLAADELKRAMVKFGPFRNGHEGYAVILEELDEMWQEVKHGTRARAREEAVQVAAMALRFLVDLPED